MFSSLTRIAGTVAIIAGFAMPGEAIAKRNTDQHFDFTQKDGEIKTTIDHGYTYIYMTCFGKDDPAKFGHDGWIGLCESPEAGVTCHFQVPHSRCSCVSDTPKAHTVRVEISGCLDN